MSFTVLAMRPMKEGTKMLMSKECGDNAIVESHCQCCVPYIVNDILLSLAYVFPPVLSLLNDVFPSPLSSRVFSMSSRVLSLSRVIDVS